MPTKRGIRGCDAGMRVVVGFVGRKGGKLFF